jgi:hypothetical protein
VPVVDVDVDVPGDVLAGAETSLLAVAKAIVIPTKDAPATSSMPLPSSSCA